MEQRVEFSDGTNLQVSEIRGGHTDGRESLIFMFPDTFSFDILRKLFSDKEAARQIVIYITDEDGTEHANVQQGFIHPISLMLKPEQYTMILGKQTAQELMLEELAQKLTMIDELAQKLAMYES